MIDDILNQVSEERARQEKRWGVQDHPDFDPQANPDLQIRDEYVMEADSLKALNDLCATRGCTSWDTVLLEEVYEALAEDDPAKMREELIQVAAVAVAWVEALDRRLEK